MVDSMNQERIIVHNDDRVWAYITVPVDQLKALEALLRENHISFWTDVHAISINGKPELTVINLARGVNAAQVQQLLDAAT